MSTPADREKLIAELLPLLDSPVVRKDSKRGWWAYCRAHGDGTKHKRAGAYPQGRSLTLTIEYGVDCFAGCSFEQILAAHRSAAPASLRQQAERTVQQRQSAPKPSRIPDNATMVEAYEYRDHTGLVAGVKSRWEWPDPESEKGYGKTFAWRLPQMQNWGGLDGLSMADMPLWGADLVAQAPLTTRVWIAEGENAVKAIRARNELAVCLPGSASSRDYGESLLVLKGHPVLLWPDNDEPGRVLMTELRKALRGIARTVFTVNAPVPPKGDAVEFFRQGGQIDQLLEGVVIAPTLDVLAHDHFRVRCPSGLGTVTFDFSDLTRTTGALDAELTVTMEAPGMEAEPYWQRVNLLSASARNSLRLALQEQFGGGKKDDSLNWTTLISQAYSRVRGAHMEFDRGQHTNDLPDDSGEQDDFLVEKVLPHGHPTVLFGDGEAGKSFIAISLAIAIALGTPWIGMRAQQGAVLYVDWETSSDGGRSFKVRLNRMAMGAGLALEDLPHWGTDAFPIYYWNGSGGGSLVDQKRALQRFIAKHDIRFIIIDSANPACGGNPNAAEVVDAYFNALNSLGCTTLTIAHINRDDATAGTSNRQSGNAMWHNLARRTWFCAGAESEPGTDRKQVGIFQKKGNDGPKEAPIYVDIDFGGGRRTPVKLFKGSARDSVVAMDQEAPIMQIQTYLLGEGSASPEEIAAATGLDIPTVSKELAHGRKLGRFTIINQHQKKRSEPFIWAALAESL